MGSSVILAVLLRAVRRHRTQGGLRLGQTEGWLWRGQDQLQRGSSARREHPTEREVWWEAHPCSSRMQLGSEAPGRNAPGIYDHSQQASVDGTTATGKAKIFEVTEEAGIILQKNSEDLDTSKRPGSYFFLIFKSFINSNYW